MIIQWKVLRLLTCMGLLAVGNHSAPWHWHWLLTPSPLLWFHLDLCIFHWEWPRIEKKKEKENRPQNVLEGLRIYTVGKNWHFNEQQKDYESQNNYISIYINLQHYRFTLNCMFILWCGCWSLTLASLQIENMHNIENNVTWPNQPLPISWM